MSKDITNLRRKMSEGVGRLRSRIKRYSTYSEVFSFLIKKYEQTQSMNFVRDHFQGRHELFISDVSKGVTPKVGMLVSKALRGEGDIESLRLALTEVNKLCADLEKIEKKDFIGSMSVNGICKPIDDVGLFYNFLVNFCYDLTVSEIGKLIGMAIHFDSDYASKKPNHNINNIDIINKLAREFNSNGTAKIGHDFFFWYINALYRDFTRSEFDFILLMNRLLGKNITYNEKDKFEGVSFISPQWLLIASMENKMSDHYEKLGVDEAFIMTLSDDELGNTKGRIKIANERIYILEQIYYYYLSEYLQVSGVIIPSEFSKRLEKMFERSKLAYSLKQVFSDEEILIIEQFMNFLSTKPDISKIISADEYNKFINLMIHVISQRFALKDIQYDLAKECLDKKNYEETTLVSTQSGVKGPVTKYRYDGTFSRAEQHAIEELDKVYDPRRSCIINLPSESVCDFLASLPSTVCDSQKKKRIKQAFLDCLGEESILWLLDEKSRNIYLTAKEIVMKVNNEDYSIILVSSDEQVVSTSSDKQGNFTEMLAVKMKENKEVTISPEDFETILLYFNGLNSAYSIYKDGGSKEEDWEELLDEVTASIDVLKELLQSKGIDLNLVSALVRSKNQ